MDAMACYSAQIMQKMGEGMQKKKTPTCAWDV